MPLAIRFKITLEVPLVEIKKSKKLKSTPMTNTRSTLLIVIIVSVKVENGKTHNAEMD